ncbi:hypothetical protein Dimus_030548, partial [Dionaea muscipula]
MGVCYSGTWCVDGDEQGKPRRLNCDLEDEDSRRFKVKTRNRTTRWLRFRISSSAAACGIEFQKSVFTKANNGTLLMFDAQRATTFILLSTCSFSTLATLTTFCITFTTFEVALAFGISSSAAACGIEFQKSVFTKANNGTLLMCKIPLSP